MSCDLLDLYKSMKRIRMVEDAIANNYNNEIREMRTPIHLYNGQEAVAVGICSELVKEDVVFSNHRSHGHYLAKGGDLNKLIAELHNRETGCCRGRGGSMHLLDADNGVALTSAIVAGNVSIGTGYAMAEKMKGTKNVSVVFFGDGASEEGSVYESICFAELKKLPVIFVCENNLYSIATPLSKREPNTDITSKFSTILHTYKVDGNDVLAVREIARSAVERARQGQGPTLIECMTYRLKDHHNIGDGVDNRFRTEEEVNSWKEKCPIQKLKEKLFLDKQIDEDMCSEIEESIVQEIDEAFEYARKSECPNGAKLFEGLWG